MKRRVVHVSSVHLATDPRIFEKECRSLASSGYEVTLIATGAPPAHSDFPVQVLPRSQYRLVRMLAGSVRAVARAVRLRPDLVHLHDPELIPFIPLLRARRIKVIFDAHEDIPDTMQRKPYVGALSRRALVWFGRVLVAAADRGSNGIVVATPSIGEDFSHAPQCLVQNFPILDDWETAAPEVARPRLVYVGGISEVRGAWQMMDMISDLGPRHGATLVLAGPVPAPLLDRLGEHPGWVHTEYVGVLDRQGVAQLLGTCTVGLVLFQPEPNHVNSQPTKMFEYMAAGLPVLGSDFPLWRELISGHGVGLLADPTDPAAITAKASELITDPAGAAAMGRRGREVVESTQNWRLEGARLVDFYRDLLGQTP